MSQHKNAAMAAVANVAKNVTQKVIPPVQNAHNDIMATSLSVAQETKGQVQEASSKVLEKMEETRSNAHKAALEATENVARIASSIANTQKDTHIERVKGSVAQMQNMTKDFVNLCENSRQHLGNYVTGLHNKAIETAHEVANLNLTTLEKYASANKVSDFVDAHASYFHNLPSVYGEYMKGVQGCLTQAMQSNTKPFADFYKNCMNMFSFKTQ